MENQKIKLLSLLLVLIGGGLIFFNILNDLYLKIQNNIKIKNFFELSQKEDLNNYSNDFLEKEYLALLEISDINLFHGFYSLNSKYNTVNKGIELLSEFIIPNNIDPSNIILASHSGRSKIAYFTNLDKLKLNAVANIYYNESKYIYRLENVYQKDKDGTINIQTGKKESKLILITCDKIDKTLQNIYEFKLVSVE